MLSAIRPEEARSGRIFIAREAEEKGLEMYARTDTDESFISAEERPKDGIKYFDTYDWQFTVTEKEKIQLRLKQLLGR